MSEAHGANRIELECQVLCAALRRSWAIVDNEGQVMSCAQLSELFPDLVTEFHQAEPQPPLNGYDLLGIECAVSPTKVMVAYFRLARKFLRENNPRQKRNEYFQLLNAGFILRKPRLRLSHDLNVSRTNLIGQAVIPQNGTFVLLSALAQGLQADPMLVSAPGQMAPVSEGQACSLQIAQLTTGQASSIAPQVAGQPGAGQPNSPPIYEASATSSPANSSPLSQRPSAPLSPPPPAARLPAVIELLRAARIIDKSEVQALVNQMKSFPDVPVVELLLSAGYVSEGEMKSVQLGEFLLGQGKIDIGQFCVAMYDERATGLKMAESLQKRGWLKFD